MRVLGKFTGVNGLIAVYLFGSASYGEYEPGISDLDVQAIISSPLPQSTYRKLATQLGHRAILCLARKLEFVLYTKDAVAGDGMTDYFLLDIASGRERDTMFAEPRHDRVFAAIVDCIEWRRQHESVSANATINACRTWRFTETGTWGSKAEGAKWATRNLKPEVPEVLRRVSLARRGRTSLPPGECDQFLELVLTRIRSGGS
ncbi:hypothetical protein EV421DRAFT_1892465 [Armillaria borealis]|uniref:Uncharacterized protein n=1 Tax=Armillaria borealis TaxID=47425 RepID=A0AA39J5V0_9AGAR|nr:hypothetical protein EV421DRAFT_1892465 [Armillaria borealis]